MALLLLPAVGADVAPLGLPGKPGTGLAHLPPLPAAGTVPHAAILIEGDADLCDDEDGDGVVGQDDGIVNCATADGSPGRPYVVQGWSIQVASDPTVGGTPPVRSCADGVHAALVAVCHVRKDIALRDLDLRQPLASYANGSATYRGTAIAVQDAGNVSLERAAIATGGEGMSIAGPASVRLVDVAMRPLLEDNLPGPALATGYPLVSVANADLSLERADLEATGRDSAITAEGADHADAAPASLLAIVRSRIANSTQDAVAARDVQLVVRDSDFANNGMHGVARTMSGPAIGSTSSQAITGAIRTDQATLLIEGNRFLLRGYGVATGDATGTIRLNRFMPGAGDSSTGSTDLALLAYDTQCTVRLTYNDLEGVGVSHMQACALDVRNNWWGNVQGPSPSQGPLAAGQVSLNGPMLVEPFLVAPLGLLPNLTIEHPAQGKAVHAGPVELRGSAASRDGSALERVEASRSEEGWDEAQVAEGTTTWRLALDLESASGALSVWLRSCSEVACGVPVRLDLNVTQLRPPIALLSARPDVVAPGEAVTLDASASYAPDGSPLALYRFDFGDGRRTPWQPEPIAEAPYPQPGRYVATVEVQDAEGQANVNVGQAVVHVVEPGATQGAPMPLAAAVVAVAAACALGRGARPA